jgi:acyl carrier protein
VEVPAAAQAQPAAQAPVPVAANASGLQALEQILGRFENQQKESLRIHEQYLNNDSEYSKIFSQLTQMELNVVSNQPNQTGLQALESLERSMTRFHEHQSETLRIHEQYLKGQEEFSRGFVGLVQQQLQMGQPAQQAAPARPAAAPVIQAAPVVLSVPAVRPAPVKAVEPVLVKTQAASAHVSQPEAPGPVQKAADAIPVTPAADYKGGLLKIVSEKTGYPQEMLDPNMDMEADLGIDSIKRVEILGALQVEFPAMPKPEPETLAELRTLQQILDFMTLKIGASAPALQPAAPAAAPVQAAPVSVAPVSSPAPAAAPAAVAGLTAALLQVVSEKTGYPQEMLDLAMDMEADLGIDSIKRVEILGAIQVQFPHLPKPEPEALSEMRTLGNVVSYMQSGSGSAPLVEEVQAEQPALAAVPAVVEAGPAPTGISSEEIAANLLRVVSEKTGYPQEMLDPNMDMEADLGIDSIKRVEILGAIQQVYPALPKPEPETLAELRTLQQVIDFLVKGKEAAPAAEVERPFA